MATKWPVKNAWVNKKPTQVDIELSTYHPDTDTRHREINSYLMDLTLTGSNNQYIIQVKNKGPDGPTKPWAPLTQELLLKICLNETSPSQLESAPNISLEKVIKQTFGRWKYVTMTVNLEIKTDPNTRKEYREYTTTMVWSQEDGSSGEASLGKTTTSYKWRD